MTERCDICGRKRPVYPVRNEDGEPLDICADCISLRAVTDDE